MVQLVKIQATLKVILCTHEFRERLQLAKTDGQIHFWGEMNSSVPCALD